MRTWVYGDILRRAVTMKPLVWQYLMFIQFRGISNFAAVRVNEWDDGLGATEQVGYISDRWRRDLFELAPEDGQ